MCNVENRRVDRETYGTPEAKQIFLIMRKVMHLVVSNVPTANRGTNMGYKHGVQSQVNSRWGINTGIEYGRQGVELG